jgi:hypothetical protein
VQGSDDRLRAVSGPVERGARASRWRIWLARACIGLVLAWNVQCAVAFLVAPATYASGFELNGDAGSAAVRGIGLLFLMWNVPYAVALWHPVRHRVSLYEALAMQAIGLLGESLIFLSLSAAHSAARASLARFIAFDAAGLALLALAWLATRGIRN